MAPLVTRVPTVPLSMELVTCRQTPAIVDLCHIPIQCSTNRHLIDMEAKVEDIMIGKEHTLLVHLQLTHIHQGDNMVPQAIRIKVSTYLTSMYNVLF